jgi:hypothetical protein
MRYIVIHDDEFLVFFLFIFQLMIVIFKNQIELFCFGLVEVFHLCFVMISQQHEPPPLLKFSTISI